MKSINIVVALVFSGILAISSSAHAMVAFEFEGVVTSTNKEAVFQIGQGITGQYSFDPSIDDLNPGNTEQGVYDAVRGFSFTTEAYTANATPSNSANSGGDIIVNRNSVFDPQEYNVFLQINDPDEDRWGPDVGGEKLVRILLKLEGGSQQPIDSIDLPLNPPNLSAFDSAILGLYFEFDPTGPEGAGVKFAITSLTTSLSTIPLPAAVWLFGTAIIGLVGFGRRRKAA